MCLTLLEYSPLKAPNCMADRQLLTTSIWADIYVRRAIKTGRMSKPSVWKTSFDHIAAKTEAYMGSA